MVKILRSRCEKPKSLIEKEPSLLKKCILSKSLLTSQSFGPLLEKELKKTFELSDKLSVTSGDASYINSGVNYKVEIKVSLGSLCNKFNFVQLRPNHDIDYYLFMTYDHDISELGEMSLFLIPSDKIKDLIIEFPSYAHGTVAKQGIISINNENFDSYEYALRPNYKDNNPTSLWSKLIVYKKSEQFIRAFFSK